MSVYSQECASFLQQLIRIPSVNGVHTEFEVVKLIANTCDVLGLPYTIIAKNDERPNIIVGENMADPKSLLFVAHSDTVPEGAMDDRTYPPFDGVVEEDRMYGRGALDCKGGIATSLFALKVLYDIGHKHAAKLLVGVDEESGADSELGVKYILQQGLKASGAIYTYGGDDNRTDINIGHRGLLRIRVTCHGQAVHAGSKRRALKQEGENAIDGLFQLTQEFTSHIPPTKDKYFVDYPITITPTLFSGGEGESIVPSYAKMLLDIRTLPSINNTDIIAIIEDIAKKLSAENKSYMFEIKNNIPAALSNPNDVLITHATAVLQQRFGHTQADITIKGSGPANESYMFIEQGIPTIAGLGPRGKGFHAANEHIFISSISDSISVLSTIAKTMVNG